MKLEERGREPDNWSDTEGMCADQEVEEATEPEIEQSGRGRRTERKKTDPDGEGTGGQAPRRRGEG